MSTPPAKAKAIQITVLVIAWIWIAVPLGWGVHQSVQKSMPLFQGAVAVSAVPRQPTP
ncbi:MAG: oxalate:formate antiporter [Proteobacteria bacterium]|nr:oxalate:formate antiporter [Verrucomicrobiota bacterium]NBU10379.1 oxalate:formate antiporter [Pseudomonadota bacterium]